MSDAIVISGRITDVFGHRFVVETAAGTRALADLGPAGCEVFALAAGLEIEAEGTQKPSELKIRRIARKGAPFVVVEHGAKQRRGHDDREAGDPDVVMSAVKNAGGEPLGAPRRKPKHFEVLARKGGAIIECHVTFDGTIRKEKPVAPDDSKWAAELKSAA